MHIGIRNELVILVLAPCFHLLILEIHKAFTKWLVSLHGLQNQIATLFFEGLQLTFVRCDPV